MNWFGRMQVAIPQSLKAKGFGGGVREPRQAAFTKAAPNCIFRLLALIASEL